MGFYETYYLIKALHFVPGIEGVTSSNVKKIDDSWYYIKLDKKLEIGSFVHSQDLSDIICMIDENEIDNVDNYDTCDIITEECSLKGLKLDWYILVNGFTTLNNNSYTSLTKITNNKNLEINKETIQKYRKIENNNKILKKMENIQNQIKQLNLEHEKLKSTLIE